MSIRSVPDAAIMAFGMSKVLGDLDSPLPNISERNYFYPSAD